MKPTAPIAAILLVLVASGALAANERLVFQSDKDFAKFGYDYREGVEWYGADLQGWGVSHCYKFSATNDNFDYLGKHLGDQKRAYKVGFSIEAGTDGRSSTIVAAYSFHDAIPDSTTKGNGKTTGAFQDSIKAKFREDGNNWRIHLTEVINGIESSISQEISMSGPNAMKHFSFAADSRDRSARVLDANDNEILSATMSQTHQGSSIHSQWFIAAGSNGVFQSITCLDNNAPSTWIWDLDDQAPIIESVTYTPLVVNAGDAITVTATVTDDWSDLGKPTAVLHYQVDAETTTQIDMTPSGSTYTATIPGQAPDAQIRFWVKATDNGGQNTVSNTYIVTVGSTEPVEEQPPPECTDCGNGNVDEPALSGGKAILVAVLVTAAVIALGLIVASLTRNPRLLSLFTILGVFGGLSSALYVGNIGGFRDLIDDSPGGIALLIGGAAAFAFLYLLLPTTGAEKP